MKIINKYFFHSLAFFLLPLVVFGFTSFALTAQFSLHFALVMIIVALFLFFLGRNKYPLLSTVANALVILLLVGSTGWFVSPFFFVLYLFPMYLGFLYVPVVALSFLAGLLLIFLSSVGEVDVAFDVMTLLSLLIAIPLIMYLRKRYLILRQTDKDILILEDESGIKDADTIGKLLANRVTNLGVTVRQPLTFIKQASQLLLHDELSPEEATTYLKRIETTATETLDHVRKFEGDTSMNEVLTNKAGKTIAKPKGSG